MDTTQKLFAAFLGDALLARGALAEVALACKVRVDGGATERLAVFDDETGRIVELDCSGTEAEVLARLPRPEAGDETGGQGSDPPRRGPGRPALGVVSREVSLTPAHWEWLAEQRGSASATLRRLVEMARRSDAGESTARRAIDAAHRFLWDIAGNQPDFEEATRALFARDFDRLRELTANWPPGIRDQLGRHIARARATAPVPPC